MRLLINLFVIVTCVVLVSPQKDDDNDESKPYEFAFTIDGEQHRHEKKDAQGIIQGEFGFITADGIYHVTVYATDENGDFKILSMRNIRISAPLDGSPLPPGAKIESLPGISAPQSVQTPQSTPPPQVGYGVDNREISRVSSPRPLPLSYQNPVNQQEISVTTQRSKGPYAFTTQSTIKPACGGCGYVTTAKPINGKPTFQFQTPQFQDKANYPETGLLSNPLNSGTIPQKSPANSGVSVNTENQSFKPFGGENGGFNNNPVVPNQKNQGFFNGPVNLTQQNQGFFNGPVNPTQQNQGFFNGPINPEIAKANLETNPEIIANPLSRPEAPLNPPVNQPPSRLSQVSVSDGLIHVPGQDDIPIRDKYPGMVDGLPAGIQEKDITDLLYKFHYEVGFHGHYEKGTKSGAKIGGYFVNGRDGLSRIVTYVADENGFQPKFKFVRLGLDSPDTPKPDSEKTFGLKSFEFIWYPVD